MEYWTQVISSLEHDGHEVCQIGQTGEGKIAQCQMFDMKMVDLREFIRGFDHFVSVDNFFHHFAHWYGFSGVVIFSQSDPNIYGYRENINLLKDRKYLRREQFQIWEASEYIPEAYVAPEIVIDAINKF